MAAKQYKDELLSLPLDVVSGKIGVVTVLFNSATVLSDFFASLGSQTYKNFVVYCIDNASKDDSVAMCAARELPYIIIPNATNLGVATGNNQGIRAAVADGCETVLMLNNDVVFGSDLFQQLLDGLTEHDCSMTTPLAYYYDRPDVIWAAGGYFQPWAAYRSLHYSDGDVDHGQYPAPIPVTYTPTCCVLIRRELFHDVGLMDERYFVYFDDTDFMLRANKLGKRLFLLPQAKLWHKVSSLAGTDSPFRTKYSHRNHALYVHKHLAAPVAYAVSAIYCTAYLLMAAVRRISLQQALERIKYWQEGYLVERG